MLSECHGIYSEKSLFLVQCTYGTGSADDVEASYITNDIINISMRHCGGIAASGNTISP